MTKTVRAGAYLWVSDVAASTHWYVKTLDLVAHPYPDEKPYDYARLHAKHGHIAFVLMSPSSYASTANKMPDDATQPVVVDIDVDEPHELYRLLRRRVPIQRNMQGGPNGVLRFSVRDPDDHELVFHEASPPTGPGQPTVAALAPPRFD